MINSNKKDMLILCLTVISLNGCASTVIDATTEAAIAVAKVPFRIGGAVVDVVADNAGDDD